MDPMILSLKKFISPIVHILPFFLFIILIGFFLIFKKKYRRGISFGLFGTLSIYSFSLFPVAGLLLLPLQTQYSRYQVDHAAVRYIVVLGGWHKTNNLIPLSSQLSRDSLLRVVEAVIIYRQNPGSSLLLSGSAPQNDPKSNAQMMAAMAMELGVPNKDIILEERPVDTKDEARYIKETIREESFVLVTSASHMRRAIQLFNKQDLSPIPAPVNYVILEKIPFSFIPSAIALQSSEKSIHEYLGLIWAWLKKQI